MADMIGPLKLVRMPLGTEDWGGWKEVRAQ